VIVRPFPSVVDETARARLRPPLPLEEELALALELLAAPPPRERLEAEAELRPRRRLDRTERSPCSHRVVAGRSSAVEAGEASEARTVTEA
jgi:hypothetical protein